MWQTSPSRVSCESDVADLSISRFVREWCGGQGLPSITQNAGGRSGGDVADPCARVVVVSTVKPLASKWRGFPSSCC